jgi:hypothetical protein
MLDRVSKSRLSHLCFYHGFHYEMRQSLREIPYKFSTRYLVPPTTSVACPHGKAACPKRLEAVSFTGGKLASLAGCPKDKGPASTADCPKRPLGGGFMVLSVSIPTKKYQMKTF